MRDCYVAVMIKVDHEPLLLEARGVTKAFAGVQALKGVDLDIRAGEVHCILGQNGAGKSTLIKLLAGVYTPDEGEIRWQGEPVTIPNPVAAISMGIATMYQELDVVDGLSIAENIFLGHEFATAGVMQGRPDEPRGARAADPARPRRPRPRPRGRPRSRPPTSRS